MVHRLNRIRLVFILILFIGMLGSVYKVQAFSMNVGNEWKSNHSINNQDILRKNGRFFVNGKAFIPIGFNYWPPSTGVRCWEHFNIHEWENDFKAIHDHGYNTVRIFLLWQDFQPGPHSVNKKDLDHLKEVCDVASRYHIWLVPTLFQGWMSGTNFVPKWATGKNYIRDPQMQKAMDYLASQVALTLKNEQHILAIDLANEIDVIQPDVTPADVAKWTSKLSNAIKKKRPGTIITNGSAIRGASNTWPFSAENVDVYSMHSYPFWNPVIPQRLSDFDATVAYGFNTAYARSYGPVMLEEFGFAFGGDSQLMGRYLRANALSAFLSGANSFLYWCWSDFKTTKEPYQSIPSESSLGYVSVHGKSKIWSHYYDQVKDFVTKYSNYYPVSSGVAIYRPLSYDTGGKAADKALSTAYIALVANGITPKITGTISDSYKLIIVPYSKLTINEINELDRYVRNGGHLIVTNVNMSDCSQYWENLTHTRITGVVQNVESVKFPFRKGNIVMKYQNKIPVLKPISSQADILEKSFSGIPMIIKNVNGKGDVVQFIGPIDNVRPPKYSRSYVELWKKLLGLSGFKTDIQISKPYVQSGIIKDAQGDKKLVLINHLYRSTQVVVNSKGKRWSVTIGAKNYKIFSIKQPDSN